MEAGPRVPAAAAAAAAEQARKEAAQRRRRGEPAWETSTHELVSCDIRSVAAPSHAVVVGGLGGQAVFASYLQALATSGDQGPGCLLQSYPSGTVVVSTRTPDGSCPPPPIDLSEKGLKNAQVLRERFHSQLHRVEAMSVMRHFTPPREKHDLVVFPGQPNSSTAYVCLPSSARVGAQDDGLLLQHAVEILVADGRRGAPAPPAVDTDAVAAARRKGLNGRAFGGTTCAGAAYGTGAGDAPPKQELVPGDCVALHGLQTTSLNGKRGAVSATAAKSPGRVGVLIEGERKPRAIKIENLAKVLPACTLAELDAAPWVEWLTPASVMTSLPLDAVWRVGGPTPESQIDTSLDDHIAEWCSAARPPSLAAGSVGVVFTGLHAATGVRVEAVVTAPVVNTLVAQYIASKALVCLLCKDNAQFPFLWASPTENEIITQVTTLGVSIDTGKMFAATPLRELAALTMEQCARRFVDDSRQTLLYRAVHDDTPCTAGEIGRMELPESTSEVAVANAFA